MIILATLKLTGTIDWSWWWVFSPVLVPVLIWLALLLIGLIGWLVTSIRNR